MTPDQDLQEFAKSLRQEIISRAQVEDEEEMRENSFTHLLLEDLEDADETDNAMVCFHRTRGQKVNAWGYHDEMERVDLFCSVYTDEVSPRTITKQEVVTAFKRLGTFLKKALNGSHQELEESSEVFDLAKGIHNKREKISLVTLFVLTDGLVKSRSRVTIDLDIPDVEVRFQIWDIQRLYRLVSSGQKREPIQLDLLQENGSGWPFLKCPAENPEYDSYLLIMPATTLAELYGRYGPRLLEHNVRCFLQVRSNVNKGIRDTVMNKPQMFLAYNNGISTTADKILIKNIDGVDVITRLLNFQIVNGGQTTAAIHHCLKKEKSDLSEVFVQMKLTVIKDSKKIPDYVPLISRYANSQNRVNTADFSSNHPFHVALEELSRTVWAPAKDGTDLQTHWFFERSRGQYLDHKGREPTRGKKKSFEQINPRKQMFKKTDLGKFENTWKQKPWTVSRGAQKNFAVFMLRVDERGAFVPREQYFRELVAKAILFRSTETLVSKHQFGGYRANIVTYTLAWIFHATANRIDLDAIWKNQSLSDALSEWISEVSVPVQHHIVNPPGGMNISEWSKKEKCWKTLLEKSLRVPAAVNKELVPIGKKRDETLGQGIDAPSAEEEHLIDEMMKVPADHWLALARWAKQTNNLRGWQRRIAFTIGSWIKRDDRITRKQAIQGKKILDEASKLGFKLEATPDN